MGYKENYDFWAKQQLPDELRQEIDRMSKTEAYEAFYTDLGFGTGGMRGLMGVGTNRINVFTIRRATLGFARYLKQSHLKNGVAISYDNRKDSELFAREAAKVLAFEGIPSFLFHKLRPTPMLSFAVRELRCDGGIMITASHNPKAYNGFKAYDHTGAQISPKVADMVISEVEKIENPFLIETIDNDLIKTIDEPFDDVYLNLVKNITILNEDKHLKIVYSPLHGTGGTVIPRLLKDAGYDVYPYKPQMMIDPTFSATKSSNPEEAAAYEKSIAYAKEIDADLVMLTDPDADRLGIAVKHEGQFELLNGNQTASLELHYILNQFKKAHRLPTDGHVYTTNVTTDLIKRIADDFQQVVITTLTGFKFIGEQAEIYHHTNPYLFGAEESYGSLIADFVRDKDAVQAVYMLAEMANHFKREKKTLVDYLHDIYAHYGAYYEYTHSITLQGSKGVQLTQDIVEHFRKHPPMIGLNLMGYDDILNGISVMDGIKEKLHYPRLNVMKYYYEDDTWIVFRPSGTEPKLKAYYGTKKKTLAEAKAYLKELDSHVFQDIDKLKELL